MEHKEYIRICDNSTVAVLFIHGILGTPNHFRELVSFVPKTISVYNLLLDGHGKSVKDFSKTSLTHEKIYIVAHSLGTLLAIEQAVKNKKICRLFLLAVPLRLSVKIKMLINSLKVYFDKISSNDYQALAAKKCYGIAQDKNPFHYIGWIPRFLELFAKIRQTRKLIPLIRINCAVYQSCKDEMVSRRSIKYIRNNPYILVNELNKSGHYYYDKEDFDFLITEFNKVLTIET